ncbi:MAG: DUF4153 domain-containing protein [Firmicutes bacterium]|nr:DUF4153 domain-containing protein [Bacillota bacterium]
MSTRRARFILFCKTLLTKLVSSLQRFPETLLFCCATAIVLIMLNHRYADAAGEPGEFLIRLALVLALGIPLTLCLRVFRERTPLKAPLIVLLYAAAAGGLVLYHFFLLKDFEMISLSRYTAVSLALYLAFTFIPYFYRKENYELYMIGLFISLAITYLFAGVLYGGLAAILGTINYLFSANIPVDIYSDIWFIVGGIFAPAFFLAEIPASGTELEPESYPRLINILLSYIVIPLLLIYCAILYLYFIRIVVLQQWPELMVSHLVLWYALVSTLVLFCVYPLRQSNRWTKGFLSFYPKVILPLLGLMFVAMGIRINHYGITENRYFVLAAGLWVTGSMIYLTASRKPRHIYLPASLALVALLSVSGPWSAYAVSIRSQNRHFETIAAEYKLIEDGEIVKPAAPLPETVREEISSIITYFDRYHKLEQLHALPEGFTIEGMEPLFGFPLYEYTYPGREDLYFHHFLTAEEACCWDISGYDYFLQFSSTESRFQHGALEISYDPGKDELAIALQGQPLYNENVGAIAARLHEDAGESGKDLLSKEEMTFVRQSGPLELLYIFRTIGGWEEKATAEVHIDYLEFSLFIALEGALSP